MEGHGPEGLELLRELVKWQREAVVPSVKERVLRLVDTDSKKRVYEAMAEGTSSPRTLETKLGVGRNTIQTWATEWEAERIVESASTNPRALFTLKELSIPAAPPKPSAKAKVGKPSAGNPKEGK